MNRDKQIEEMARAICEHFVPNGCGRCPDCFCEGDALKLYNAGYRKASEVAREIFEEIEEVFRQHTDGGYYLNNAWIPEYLDPYTQDAVAKLKKKYTEGEG